MKKSRRNILKGMAVAGAAAHLPLLGKASSSYPAIEQSEQMTILFQGDSITDAGRNKGQYYANQHGRRICKAYSY